MALVGRKPRQLAHFRFPYAGTKYLSDQALGAADGLSHEYAALIEDWGELNDMAGGDEEAIATSEIRQLSLTIWNGGTTPFSDYFLEEDPENVLVDIYQWFDGLSASDAAIIDTFVIQDPIAYDEASRLLRLDLVSVIMLYDRPLNDTLRVSDWPNAKTEDVGKGIDLILGTVSKVPTICARTAPQATLNGSILENSATINVNEDLDTLGFSASGAIQVGEEKIRYSSRTSSAFTVAQRGWTTTASEHLDRDEVVELITDHTYLIGKGPVSAISDVKVDGFAAPAGIYTTYPATNPAKIVFSEKPFSIQYAKGRSFLEMQFDVVNTENTAYQAYKAYDAANLASAAMINKSYPLLSLKQATVNPDRGEIVKAYLAIEHWESGPFANDYAQVWIEGIGNIGRLSRPNPDDYPDLEAEVDIDHGHAHQIGGDHVHAYVDPGITTKDAPHTHATDGVSVTQTYYPSEPLGFELYAYVANQYGDAKTIRFSGLKKFDQAVLRVTVYTMGAACIILYPGGPTWGVEVPNGETIIGIQNWSSGSDFFITFRTKGWGVVGGHVTVGAASVEATTLTTIVQSYTGVTTGISNAGDVQQNLSAVKEVGDVDGLATDNVALQVTALQAPTKSNVNLFDVTDYVNFDWGWFSDRDIRVTYTGTHDDKSVYVLHAFFDVEHRKRERVFSDDVTAAVTGLIDDGSGTYTGTPSAVITRPDYVYKHLLMGCGGLGSAYVDAMTVAGARLAALGYTINGILRADLTVREAVKKVEFQTRTRLFWNGAKAKLAVREKMEDWGSADRALTADDYQLKSFSARRQRVPDIINTIDLCYDRDWTSAVEDSSGYQADTSDSDAASVTAHGVREDRGRFLFDLVTGSSMADSLLDFYIDTLKTPSTFYTFNAYLEQFDVEKEDILSVTSSFGELRKAAMVVKASHRLFGSGKLSRMNYIKIVAECLHYFLWSVNEADTIVVSDALSVECGFDLLLHDVVLALDQLTIGWGREIAEEITVSEVLSIIAVFNSALSDTAVASEALSIEIGINLAETVKIHDVAKCWNPQFGFGAGYFGTIGFGGYSLFGNLDSMIVEAADELALTIGPVLADSATASEILYFSAGFGGNDISNGFGLGPFGS